MKQYQMHLPTEVVASPTVEENPRIAQLRAERDALVVQWNRMMDALEAMDQNTPEFDKAFAEWEKVDERYKALCDQIDYAEITANMSQK